MHKWAIPVEKEPVNLFTELNVPAMIFLIKLAVPRANPIPPSRGPWTKPSIGFSIKSYTPVATLLKKPIGLPIILREPKTWKTSLRAYSLYFWISLSVIPSEVSKQFCNLIPFKVTGASSMFDKATPSAVAKTVKRAKLLLALVLDLNDKLILIGERII